MKATGIVRRIDDLGRVVIPKEVRRAMKIREGDPLEIFTDSNGGVVFRKYLPHKAMGDDVKCLHKSFVASGINCAFYDTNGDKLFGSTKFAPTIDLDEEEIDGLIEVKDGESGDTMCYIFPDKHTTVAQIELIKLGAKFLTIKSEV